MKTLTKKEILPLILIVISFAVGIVLYPELPDKVPSHWNIRGEVDSWSSRNFAILFAPILTLIVYLLMTFLPLIDPLRRNYNHFVIPYFWFRTSFVIFFTLLNLYVLWSGLGFNLKINYFIIPVLSAFFIVIGLFLPKAKKNYFVGIRTPWTIHSERVWDKTHQFSGKLFVIVGIIALLGLFLPSFAFIIFISSVSVAALISIVYSYFIFREIEGFNN
jgi:uncharacterized membrane protein